ncbi:hypothetical protein G6F22_015537 [Rhizopus arrhizus]|nr:hypothetical protein G6F22_015537 [Rhizopus arrhizus]
MHPRHVDVVGGGIFQRQSHEFTPALDARPVVQHVLHDSVSARQGPQPRARCAKQAEGTHGNQPGHTLSMQVNNEGLHHAEWKGGMALGAGRGGDRWRGGLVVPRSAEKPGRRCGVGTAAAPAPAPPPIKHPLDTGDAADPALPRLAESDAAAWGALSQLFQGEGPLTLLLRDHLIQRLVTQVANLDKPSVPPTALAARPLPGSLQVEPGEGGERIAASNAARYAPYVQAPTSTWAGPKAISTPAWSR